jgi:hypothetical protein
VTIHFLSPTIVHSLLLFLQLTHFLADHHALWNRTNRILTLLSMDSKQSPDSFTDTASSLNLCLENEKV